MKLNGNFQNLKNNYLFLEIRKKVEAYQNKNLDAPIIRLGVGDVTLPLCSVVTHAMHEAVEEMAEGRTFKGYGPVEGYKFLREAVSQRYEGLGVKISEDEIYISSGSKDDVSNILDLFSADNAVLIPDPVYPVYMDANILGGRRIEFVDAVEENNFLPLPNKSIRADIIFLCSPNNPTGGTYNKEQLKLWVDYAFENDAVILFDAAYEAFIADENLPHSIFEIEGAKECAVEFCSFSKSAGFTGVRCAYAVIPKELKKDGVSLSELWLKRQSIKFNGVSYVTQKGAAAALSKEGQVQTKELVAYYQRNAKILANAMKTLGVWFTGGENSPYVWFKCPGKMTSWEFFYYLLESVNIVGTPGSGFGKNGEDFFRLSAFGDYQNILEAVNRLKSTEL